jgi:hypothetical protein
LPRVPFPKPSPLRPWHYGRMKKLVAKTELTKEQLEQRLARAERVLKEVRRDLLKASRVQTEARPSREVEADKWFRDHVRRQLGHLAAALRGE